jgi:DNA primase
MEHEKYSYVEALRWLANKYNVEIEETGSSPEIKLQLQTAESLYIINGFAQKYFSEILWENEWGQDIGLSYLKERGFREDIIRKFQLGYCLEAKDSFTSAALEAQYNPEFLQKTGLSVMRDDRLVDNYRGRIIFPVHSQTGKICGFGARIIRNNDRAPKYINTPENEIYVKSKILYGSYFARQAIDKLDECLLVEGYTDTIALHQAGIENVVASGGTSLTQDQLRLIKKYTNNLTIIYDGDAAGVKAALRGLDMALEESLNVQLVLIPDNEDPDSFINKQGAATFRDFIQKNKKDFILFQLDIALKDSGNDSHKKAVVVNQVAETISKINKAEDFTKQQDYIRRCAELLKIEEAGLHALVNKHIRERMSKLESRFQAEEFSLPASGEELVPDADSFQLLSQDELQERAMIRSLLEFGLKTWNDQQRVADFILSESIDHDMIDNLQLLKIFETYVSWYEQGLEPTSKNFIYHEDQSMSALVVSIMDFAYELSPNWKDHFEGKIYTRDELYKEEVLGTLNYLKLRKIKKLIDLNQKDLINSASAEEQHTYMQTHQHLKNMEKEILENYGTVILK